MAPPSRMATLDSPLFKCCHELRTLGWSDDAAAKALLARAADHVRPIMARRRWAVPLLAEFYPPAPQLLGLNHAHGAKIEVRLRRPSDPRAFLPYDAVLATLLHELAHIQVGPHNPAFYALLDELRAESDALAAPPSDRAPAQPFAGPGRRVAEALRPSLPMHVARERAVAAAARRRARAAVMPVGGRRLGGEAGVARLCDPREMALAAAVRRRADEVWCGSAAPPAPPAHVASGAPDAPPAAADDDGEVVFVRETRAPPRPLPRPRRSPAHAVPVRHNAAARAALQRAQHR